MGKTMRIKLFTLRFSSSCGGFDESPLQDFVRDKELLAFREHFFTNHDVPHLACVIAWQEPRVPAELDADSPRDEASPRSATPIHPRASRDPLAELDDPSRALFQTLRAWRAETARREGVPPYVVFTNRQLAEIVRRRPESANALAQIGGVGPGKVKRYGPALLRELLGGPPEQSSSEPDPGELSGEQPPLEETPR